LINAELSKHELADTPALKALNQSPMSGSHIIGHANFCEAAARRRRTANRCWLQLCMSFSKSTTLLLRNEWPSHRPLSSVAADFVATIDPAKRLAAMTIMSFLCRLFPDRCEPPKAEQPTTSADLGQTDAENEALREA
jgi:hypothetical protein